MQGVSKIENRKTQISVGLLIFLCFLWTGSAYITWLYHLTESLGSFSADWLSQGVGYVFQAVGILIFALFVKHKPAIAKSRHFLTGAVLADGAFMTAAVVVNNGAVLLIFGLLMNLFHGVIAGIYLTKLAVCIPQQKRGKVFGVAYGLGSIGSWLLSLPMNKSFLHSNYVLIAYFVLIGFVLLVNYKGEKESTCDNVGNSPDFRRPELALIVLVVVLLSVVKGLGFYFPISESVGGIINLEFSRSFYAVGLIAAGFIGDKNRKYGAICCLAALVFPFLSFALGNVANASAALWIFGYIFFGFFAVYRVVVFCDIAAKKSSMVWMAGFGLLFGRIGDAASAVGDILLEKYDVALISVTAVLFVAVVLLFFALYHKLYVPVLTQEQNEEQLLTQFETQFGFSARECDVFRLVAKGRSNAEIAGDLYISESTVKFHVKNVLKKTQCKNRTELMVKFKPSTAL